MTPIRTRFAPSPTGFLHLGHVVSAVHAQDLSRNGGFIIRIEDIDKQRCTPAFTTALIADLMWLGFTSGHPIRQQSSHFGEYETCLELLRRRGLLYPCTCSRQDIATHARLKAPDGSLVYPGTCRHRPVPTDRPVTWRLNMAAATAEVGSRMHWQEIDGNRVERDVSNFGDIVLGRRDSGVSYHLCVTHDDHVQDIDIVTRGRDLFEATAIHRLLQILLGYRKPRYAHHALLMAPDGRKLSKRDGSESVRSMKSRGMTPSEVRAAARSALIRADRSADT